MSEKQLFYPGKLPSYVRVRFPLYLFLASAFFSSPDVYSAADVECAAWERAVVSVFKRIVDKKSGACEQWSYSRTVWDIGDEVRSCSELQKYKSELTKKGLSKEATRPAQCATAPWTGQLFVPGRGSAGSSTFQEWFSNRRLWILEQKNRQHREERS